MRKQTAKKTASCRGPGEPGAANRGGVACGAAIATVPPAQAMASIRRDRRVRDEKTPKEKAAENIADREAWSKFSKGIGICFACGDTAYEPHEGHLYCVECWAELKFGAVKCEPIYWHARRVWTFGTHIASSVNSLGVS